VCIAVRAVSQRRGGVHEGRKRQRQKRYVLQDMKLFSSKFIAKSKDNFQYASKESDKT
jgi:hypothetical protein